MQLAVEQKRSWLDLRENEMKQKEALVETKQKDLIRTAMPDRKMIASGVLTFGPVVLVIAGVLMLICAAAIGGKALESSYQTAKAAAENEVYQTYYDWGYQNYRVTNEAKIQLDSLKQESKLEVLKVRDMVYQLEEKEGNEAWWDAVIGIFTKAPTVWLEVPGEGVFTVDMKQSEFIVDEERQYVLIRVPDLELSNFRIVYDDTKTLYYQDGGWMHNAVGDGIDEVKSQAEAAQNQLMVNIQSNQQFYKAAKDATKRILTDWVKQLNPELPDLVVEVEFMDI